ncbi:MAG: hypothetical protein QXT63_01995 [Thermoplasmata archaeon]
MERKKMEFRYSGGENYIRILALSVFTVSFALFPILFNPPLWKLLIFEIIFLSIMLLYISVMGVSPLLTCHEVLDEGIRLRYGWYFSAFVKYTNIAKVEHSDAIVPSYGVSIPMGHNKLFIVASKVGLVSIKLKESQKFKGVFNRKADEIIVSVDAPDLFIEKVNEKISS